MDCPGSIQLARDDHPQLIHRVLVRQAVGWVGAPPRLSGGVRSCPRPWRTYLVREHTWYIDRKEIGDRTFFFAVDRDRKQRASPCQRPGAVDRDVPHEGRRKSQAAIPQSTRTVLLTWAAGLILFQLVRIFSSAIDQYEPHCRVCLLLSTFGSKLDSSSAYQIHPVSMLRGLHVDSISQSRALINQLCLQVPTNTRYHPGFRVLAYGDILGVDTPPSVNNRVDGIV